MPTRRTDRPCLRLHKLALWAGVLCAMAGTLSAAGADDSPAELRRQVAQRVSELASPLRAERMQAEQALLDLGPRILELLPAPEEITDQATRVAVRQLRIKLERIAAEQSVQPSHISFQGQATVAELAAQIAAQTDNPIDLGELNAAAQSRTIDVDFRDRPFWDSLDSFTEAARLAWQPATDNGGLQLVDPAGIPKPRPAQIANVGAFRVSLDPLTRQRGTLRASFKLLSEPRLRPLFVRIADADFSAESDGHSLPLFSPRAVTELPMTSRNAASFAVLFRAAGDPPSSPVTVRGRATVHVAAAPAEVRFDDLSGKRMVYLRRGGVSVTLKRSTLSTGADGKRLVTARLAVAYDTGGPEFESHRTWIYHNDVRLESPDGTTYTPEGGFDVTQQSNGGVEVDYRFSGLPNRPLRDWQLVYVAPTLLIDAPVEFAFEDVPVEDGK